MLRPTPMLRPAPLGFQICSVTRVTLTFPRCLRASCNVMGVHPLPSPGARIVWFLSHLFLRPPAIVRDPANFFAIARSFATERKIFHLRASSRGEILREKIWARCAANFARFSTSGCACPQLTPTGFEKKYFVFKKIISMRCWISPAATTPPPPSPLSDRSKPSLGSLPYRIAKDRPGEMSASI